MPVFIDCQVSTVILEVNFGHQTKKQHNYKNIKIRNAAEIISRAWLKTFAKRKYAISLSLIHVGILHLSPNFLASGAI